MKKIRNRKTAPYLTVYNFIPCISFAVAWGSVCSALTCRTALITLGNGLSVDSKNQFRPVRGLSSLTLSLFSFEFPFVSLRIEFPCILQRLSIDERCRLPVAEPDKATGVLSPCCIFALLSAFVVCGRSARSVFGFAGLQWFPRAWLLPDAERYSPFPTY